MCAAWDCQELRIKRLAITHDKYKFSNFSWFSSQPSIYIYIYIYIKCEQESSVFQIMYPLWKMQKSTFGKIGISSRKASFSGCSSKHSKTWKGFHSQFELQTSSYQWKKRRHPAYFSRIKTMHVKHVRNSCMTVTRTM